MSCHSFTFFIWFSSHVILLCLPYFWFFPNKDPIVHFKIIIKNCQYLFLSYRRNPRFKGCNCINYPYQYMGFVSALLPWKRGINVWSINKRKRWRVILKCDYISFEFAKNTPTKKTIVFDKGNQRKRKVCLLGEKKLSMLTWHANLTIKNTQTIRFCKK